MDKQDNDINNNGNHYNGSGSTLKKTVHLADMYENWFLDYASYVILERAVPELKDGLKPVHRRLLHAMKELDDGRYNKVANIIGHTMKYHPHGDASIGDALVQMGQKDLLIDTQGNWGNILTGDSAAAPRYIEARLSKFALDVAFNPKTTQWKPSYDGRNKEPVTLPVKFPLLLAQGSDGIAVGLASKILPHNFNELIDACIKLLKGEPFEIYPDFPTGGLADFTKYNKGLRGGRVKVRAKINLVDNKTIAITELPYGKTTSSLIESIITANDKGKIKIKKIEDNTAENVEIHINIAPGISPDQTIDALYAFTDCELSISPNACVIDDNKPRFLCVHEQLEISNRNTLALLELELKIKMKELNEQLFFSSLEKIFIEKRIYRKIEKSETWKQVIDTISTGLEPYTKNFYRPVVREDIIRLTEIKIKRISKYDSFKADKLIKDLQAHIKKTQHALDNLVAHAIKYYQTIKDKYGKGKERRTEIRNFDVIEATKVAVANEKLYVNKAEGFAGTSLKKDDYVCECSDIDDIIAIKQDGSFIVTKVANKVFLGKNIIHIAVFQKNDERTIYNMCYFDGEKRQTKVKRFAIQGVQRDKEYSLIKGNKYSKVLYLTANPNGEAEVITVHLKPKPRLKKQVFDFDFTDIDIKNRSAAGNILTKNPIKKIVLKFEGASTLSAIDVWFDVTVKKINYEERGTYLGSFSSDDKIIAFYKSGFYRITGYDITTYFDEDLLSLSKLRDDMCINVLYFDQESTFYYLKRFNVEFSDKNIYFLNEDESQKLIDLTCFNDSLIHIKYPESKRRKITEETIKLEEFVGVKSFKAKGKRVSSQAIETLELQRPEHIEEPAESTNKNTQQGTVTENDISKKDNDQNTPKGEVSENREEKLTVNDKDKDKDVNDKDPKVVGDDNKDKETTQSKQTPKQTKDKRKPKNDSSTLNLFSGLEDENF